MWLSMNEIRRVFTFVLTILLPLCVFLTSCSSSGGSPGLSATARQTPNAQATAAASAQLGSMNPPNGWSRVLAGMRFTDPTAQPGLVASAAKPGRLVGCAQTASSNRLLAPRSLPVLMMSDDAGRTWQSYTISGARPVDSCSVVADTQQPDTFAVTTVGDAQEGVVVRVTVDAGRSWHIIQTAEHAFGLVGGRLLATIYDPTSSTWQLGEISVNEQRAESWQRMDTGLPGFRASSIAAAAIDSNSPAAVFVAMSAGAFGVRLYATWDSGASWQAVLQMPTAQYVRLWTTNNHHMFLEQERGQNAEYQLYASANDGKTWQGIGLHYHEGGEPLYISPGGRIVTFSEMTAGTFKMFYLSPETGIFSLIGTYTLGTGANIGVVVDGSSRVFLYASTTDTYELPLPSPS